MKKFQFSVFAIMIMALVCVGFASCGSDDEENNTKPSEDNDGSITKIDPVPEKIKPYVGYWSISADDSYHHVTYPNYAIFFYQDGKCEVENVDDNRKEGYFSWDYDETTKYLSIAGFAKGQWQITSIDENAWSGLALWSSGNNAYSARRKEDKISFILSKEWICNDSIKAQLSKDYYNNYFFHVDLAYDWHENANSVRHSARYQYNYSSPLTIVEEKEKDIITIQKEYNYKAEKEETKRSYIKIVIVHPDSFKDVYLNIFCRHYDASFSGKFVPLR